MFDGITIAALCSEFRKILTGGRIARIAQTESDELFITVRPLPEKGGGQIRLFLCADPSLPLCYLTQENKPSPAVAPAFCMLLRKHLQGGRIIDVSQPGLERILFFDIEHYNEMGDLCVHRLCVELMGKHSNIILTEQGGVITDSIKRISSMVSSVREVLPGREYFIPQTQNKKDPLAEDGEEIDALLSGSDLAPARVLAQSYQGISSQMAEEILHRAGVSHLRSASALSSDERLRIRDRFLSVMQSVKDEAFAPAVYYAAGDRSPYAYGALSLTMLSDMVSRPFPDMSSLLQTYYEEKSIQTRIRQKSADLRKIVQTILERDVHKYDLQRKQLSDTEKKDKFRLYGELLNAYGYSVPEGASSVELDNYYDGGKVKIPLDPTLSASQNAVRYFDRYAKMKRTQEALGELMRGVKAQIDQLQGIRMALDMATTEGDLQQIREELQEGGFIRRRNPGAKEKGKSRTPAGKPLHYISSDGYDIYVGKNNTQNDQLTFHMARGTDIWFHANDMPGSHVILKAGQQKMDDIPDRAFEEAAGAAAYYSAGKEQEKVEIDYLYRRDVKKPSGAAPGFVVYYTNFSILAKPDISALKAAGEEND